MKVLVTGATGFVGSHATVALLRAGHEVRALVRRPEQVPVTFGAHGVEPDEVVVGDALDEAVVHRGVAGCDAVVHAAAIFSFDARDAGRMAAVNASATRLVLDGAVAEGCDPVVHVSTFAVLARRGGSAPDLPLGDVLLPYSRSKRESEVHARALQARGHPVTIVYPGGVYGPFDPYAGENTHRLAWVARGRMPLWPATGMHTVDVRDVARVVAAVMEPGRGPRRYVVPGHHMRGADLYAAVSRATGRRRPFVPVPARLLGAVTAPVDAMHRVLPRGWRFPADREGAEVAARDTRFDDTPARRDLGVEPTPWQETVDDTIAWMVDAGHLPPSYRPSAR